MLMELGPCSVKRASKDSPVELEYNPYSWNSNATLIFLDQPVGVGYSYAEKGISIGTTEEAAKDVHAFLTVLFEAFNRKFGSSEFHMSGESFAGRYIRA
jgi:cathepsin A (carboxypeptidase C)